MQVAAGLGFRDMGALGSEGVGLSCYASILRSCHDSWHALFFYFSDQDSGSKVVVSSCQEPILSCPFGVPARCGVQDAAKPISARPYPSPKRVGNGFQARL